MIGSAPLAMPRFAAFVSYSSHDRLFARRLRSDLAQALGREIAYDEDLGHLGQSFVADLERGLDEAQALVVIVTPYSMASGWVGKEMEAFIRPRAEGGVPIVPLLLEWAPLPRSFDGLQHVDWRGVTEATYPAKLGELVRALGSGTAPKDAALGEIRPPLLPEKDYRELLETIEACVPFGDPDVRRGFAHALLDEPRALEDFGTAKRCANAVLVRSFRGRPPLEAMGAFLETMVERRSQASSEVAGRVAGILARVKELAAAGSQLADPLTEYRSYWTAKFEPLVTWGGGEHGKRLRDIYVELHTREGEPRMEELERGQSDLRLIDLLDRRSGRWCVKGRPGAGKTTALRELALTLLEAGGRLPIYAPLHDFLTRDAVDPIRYAVERTGTRPPKGLERALRESAERLGAPVLLFDGLDELSTDERKRFVERLGTIVHEHASSPVVVTSRVDGFERPEASFGEVELQPLDERGQVELAANWSASREDAERLIANLPGRLRDAARIPLLLTFLARTVDPERGAAKRRGELYDRAVRLCLEVGWNPVRSDTVENVDAARSFLPSFVRHLAEHRRWSWSRDEVVAALEAAWKASPDRAELEASWKTRKALLEDLSGNVGLIADQGGGESGWAFLHRSLGEYLLARAVAEDAPGPEIDVAALFYENDGEWGETFGLLLGMLPAEDERRAAWVESLVEAPYLAMRTLHELEGLAPIEAVGLLLRVEGADGDDLLRVVQGLVEAGADRNDVREAVMADLSAELDTDALAYRYFALVGAGLDPGREAFFRACDRWPEGGPETPRMARVPPGQESEVTFTMGSPEDEEGRIGDEGPQDKVPLGAFEIMVSPVTRAELAAFEEAGGVPDRPTHPATEVSWWAAWIFARWIGADLPTEAQWECACRAGTDGRFWSGETDADLERVGWYDANSGDSAHPVGEKPANAYGLHDVHGNVWEWCREHAFGAYSTPPAGREGERHGSDRHRVLRGGSFAGEAADARSASRDGALPSSRWSVLGFRAARVIA